jgi:hypothetical protein
MKPFQLGRDAYDNAKPATEEELAAFLAEAAKGSAEGLDADLGDDADEIEGLKWLSELGQKKP